MAYNSRYQREPYAQLKDSWYDYEKNLQSIENILKEIKFDSLAEKNREIKVSNFYVGNLDLKKCTYIEYLFLFPHEYKYLSIDELVETPKFPKQIEVPEHPKLHLSHDEYPPEYFKSKNGFNPAFLKLTKEIFDSFLGNEIKIEVEKNLFQKEVEHRKQIIQRTEELKNKIADKWSQLSIEKNNALAYLQKLSESTSQIDTTELLKIVNLKHEIPVQLRGETVFQLFKESQTLVIQFKFPDLTNKKIVLGFLKSDRPKLASEMQRKKLIKQCLYSMMIRIGHLAAVFNMHDLYKSVVINVEQDWFDPATGQERNGVIATLQAPTEYLQSLNLSQLDPEACFKHLKGISVPSYDNINPVRPIFELNKEDDRFIESKNVSIEEQANLAAMPWEDFEHLVAQLFEWEFARSGVEVRVTRASRDRGVDAILFDPDPLRGGKFVLQAKRYTRTVDVSAVRDLYGTVMNEGANRGILIATSSYGPDSYEFAKDKPISLVDGPNLLLMLQKHGKKFKIDLEEARRLNEENKN
jgi:restriction system protein